MDDREPEDRFNLNRFVAAQHDAYEAALAELRGGRKQSHWIWYIFPQVAGLGSSAMARHFAIHSRAEALAYLSHPVLGPRLRECVEALLQHPKKTAFEIVGTPDDLKLRSCLTLFSSVATAAVPFERALERFFAGERDQLTREFLAQNP